MTDGLQEANWFPVDLHVPRREFGFLRLDIDVLERSVFLDNRIDAPLAEARFSSVPHAPRSSPDALGWLLHTSFCCSTLLGRALHVPPAQVVLKEPLILRRLADARHAGHATAELLQTAVALLSRPWSASGSVIVKPTHAALNIADELLVAAPDSRAIVLTSALEDFLLSNIKKTRETQGKIPELAERALARGTFASRLPREALVPPDLLSAATLQWAAQRELCGALLARFGTGRIRVLDAERLLDDVPGTAEAASLWLRGAASATDVRARGEAVARTNAKAVGVEYDAARRRHDAAQIRQRFAQPLDRALHWFDRFVRPAMAPAALKLAADADTALPMVPR